MPPTGMEIDPGDSENDIDVFSTFVKEFEQQSVFSNPTGGNRPWRFRKRHRCVFHIFQGIRATVRVFEPYGGKSTLEIQNTTSMCFPHFSRNSIESPCFDPTGGDRSWSLSNVFYTTLHSNSRKWCPQIQCPRPPLQLIFYFGPCRNNVLKLDTTHGGGMGMCSTATIGWVGGH